MVRSKPEALGQQSDSSHADRTLVDINVIDALAGNQAPVLVVGWVSTHAFGAGSAYELRAVGKSGLEDL